MAVQVVDHGVRLLLVDSTNLAILVAFRGTLLEREHIAHQDITRIS